MSMYTTFRFGLNITNEIIASRKTATPEDTTIIVRQETVATL
jgi:hypothetical protein